MTVDSVNRLLEGSRYRGLILIQYLLDRRVSIAIHQGLQQIVAEKTATVQIPGLYRLL
jgi:hypothetical protein